MKKNKRILCIASGILIIVSDIIWGVYLTWPQIVEIVWPKIIELWNASPSGRNFILFINILLIGGVLIEPLFDHKGK